MKKFTRTIEAFTCGHCGMSVQGNGYTNHCPACLWSRHVDVNPGDRESSCRGLMQPAGLEIKSGTYIIIHCCIICGMKKKNKAAPEDNFEKIIELSRDSG